MMDIVRGAFDYRDGALYWKSGACRKMNAGALAGYINKRRRWRVRWMGITHTRSRLIWVWHYGNIPEGRYIDHINDEDRIENLRLVSTKENNMNRCCTGKPTGVYEVKGGKKWRALVHIGTFDSFEEAKEARSNFLKSLT
jgi:hypothetical protein